MTCNCYRCILGIDRCDSIFHIAGHNFDLTRYRCILGIDRGNNIFDTTPSTGSHSITVTGVYLVLGDSGGVVNSLDFCPASLKSLGCFYFWCVLLFTLEGSDSEFANFTLPTLKAFLEVRSHNVSGNKQ